LTLCQFGNLLQRELRCAANPPSPCKVSDGGFLEAAGAFSMRLLLSPIPAHGHAAQSSSMAASAIDARAERPFAGFYVREVPAQTKLAIALANRRRSLQRIF
jgi:microcystin-dependent protein